MAMPSDYALRKFLIGQGRQSLLQGQTWKRCSKETSWTVQEFTCCSAQIQSLEKTQHTLEKQK